MSLRARLDAFGGRVDITVTDAGWSSLVARRAHNPKVAGSNPAPATTEAPSRQGAFVLLRPMRCGFTGINVQGTLRSWRGSDRAAHLALRWAGPDATLDRAHGRRSV